MAERVARELRDLSLDFTEDDAGARIGGNTGNIVARLEPTVPGTSIFLCAHLDTVPPTDAIEPVVEDGIVRNARDTILGGDDKSAVGDDARRDAADPERGHSARRASSSSSRPRRRPGSRAPTSSTSTRSPRRSGYCYDHAGPLGEIVGAAPYSTRSTRSSAAAPRTPG